MALVVEIPDTYRPERAYVLGHVLGERLGLSWRVRVVAGTRSVRITDGASDRVVIVNDGLFSLSEDLRLTNAALPELPLTQRHLPARSSTVPVLFSEGSSTELIERHEAEIRVNADVFGGIFFMLTRLEEVINPARDGHGRLPDEQALLVKAGVDELPLADAYVELLWEAVSMAWPRLVRRVTEYAVVLSHDVDRPTTYGDRPWLRVRGIGGDLAKRHDPVLAARRLGSMVPSKYRRSLDPYDSFEFLMRVSERHGLRSAFYFMADRDRRAIDHPYNLDDSPIPEVLRRAQSGGHEVGLHTGYASYTSATLISQELKRIKAAARQAGVDQSRWGGRQHYLRWHNPNSWRAWRSAGLDYDSTIGHARRVGFRAGTCHPYEAFDVIERRPLGLNELPLVVMDGALFAQYTRAEDRLDAVRRLARQCRAYGGTLTMLWHNNGFLTVPEEWYEDLISEVVRVGA
jgi:hypothetical protein